MNAKKIRAMKMQIVQIFMVRMNALATVAMKAMELAVQVNIGNSE